MSRETPPPDESPRLKALRTFNILETPPEERFDRVTRLARRLFDVPVAHINFLHPDRLWSRSRPATAEARFARDVSSVASGILESSLFVVEDMLDDDRFRDNRFVKGDPGFRFYAGCGVRTADGSRVGTLCLMDTRPRSFPEPERELLTDLAGTVEGEIQALELATVDALTGLTNRLAFDAIAEHSLSLSLRVKRPVTLLYLDLNNLKLVNDREGHAEGDRVIAEMARLLQGTFRDSDVVARIGGDEFCVLMSGASASDVERPLAELQEKIDLANVSRKSGCDLSFSVGISVYDPDRHETVEALIEEADQAMYRDKGRHAPEDGGDLRAGTPPVD